MGRGTATVGTAAVLLALVTLAPRAEAVLAAAGADLEALRPAAGCCNDADEPTGPPPGEAWPWTVTVAATGPTRGTITADRLTAPMPRSGRRR